MYWIHIERIPLILLTGPGPKGASFTDCTHLQSVECLTSLTTKWQNDSPVTNKNKTNKLVYLKYHYITCEYVQVYINGLSNLFPMSFYKFSIKFATIWMGENCPLNRIMEKENHPSGIDGNSRERCVENHPGIQLASNCTLTQ